MKFSLFVHMERFDRQKPYRELFDELVELVDIAEAGGFATVWIGEHHAMDFTIAPNPFTFLAYLAQRTSRIRLGTGNVVAPFWHPIKLAGDTAMVDIMSRGRLDFGIARGAYQFEFDRVGQGMKAADGGKSLREMVPVLKALWQGDYAHDGEIWRFPTSTSIPKPLQQPHPPIFIAARDPNSHVFAVRHGCNVMVTPLNKPDGEVDTLVARFESALAANPGVARPELVLLRHTYLHARPQDWEVGAKALRTYYAYFESWFRNDQTVVDGFCPPLPESELASRADYALETVRRNHVIGTPDEVIPRLKRYESQGFDQYSIWLDNGLPHAEKKRMVELFIREVMPAFA